MASIIYKGNLIVSGSITYEYVFGELAGGNTWSPFFLSDKLLWLDSFVVESIILSGGTVEQWLDGSPYKLSVSQSISASRPTYTTSESVNFDGSNDYLIAQLGKLPGVNFSFYCVCNHPTQNALGSFHKPLFNGGSSDVYTSSGTGYGIGFARDPFQNFVATYRETGLYLNVPYNNAYSIYSVIFSNGTLDIYINGTLAGTNNAISTTAPSQTQYHIGGSIFSTNRYYTGGIKEVIAVDAFNVAVDREKVEGYLAHKWSLHGGLPVSHPYKSAPPPAP